MPPSAARRPPTSTRARRSAPAREAVEVRTTDGWSLLAEVHEPAHDAVGVAVLAHALMARRTSFEQGAQGGPLRALVDRGWRVAAFDFRGHGESRRHERGAARPWGYDDLVAVDVPAIYDFAQSLARRKQPLVLVGHSLGAHVALAAQGAGLVAFDGVVAIAGHGRVPELEPSGARWGIKRAAIRASSLFCRWLGRLRAPGLRAEGGDEACARVEDLERAARTGRWTGESGRVDYLASLANVRIPVLQVVTGGDRLERVPARGARFVARCGGDKHVLHVTRADDGGLPPSPMGLVTDGARVASVWRHIERWMRGLAVGR